MHVSQKKLKTYHSAADFGKNDRLVRLASLASKKALRLAWRSVLESNSTRADARTDGGGAASLPEHRAPHRYRSTDAPWGQYAGKRVRKH